MCAGDDGWCHLFMLWTSTFLRALGEGLTAVKVSPLHHIQQPCTNYSTEVVWFSLSLKLWLSFSQISLNANLSNYLLLSCKAVETPKTLPPPKVAAVVNVEEEPPAQLILLPCPICFRTFKVESLERHKNVCQKVATKKRKVFDSAKQRLEDLPDVPKVSLSPQQQQQKVLSSPLVRRSMLDTSTLSKKVPPWKEKHLSLIKTVRQARGADSNRCPCCERYTRNDNFLDIDKLMYMFFET